MDGRKSIRGGSRTVASVAGGWLALVGLVGGLVVVTIGPLAGPVLPAAAAAAPSDGTVQESGASLYLQNCASCHGPMGEGGPAGPSLVGVGEASADFYLQTGRMPLGAPNQPATRQEPHFSAERIAVLVAHVGTFGDGPAIPQVRVGGDVHRGWQLYQANCASCHAATGSGNAVGGGYAAVGLGEATPTQIAEAMLIGPGAMPLFAFADVDRDAIVAYIEYLRASPAPGGAPIGGIGPVAEGFVAIVIGLTVLLLVARFVGRKSHEEEPDVGDAPVVGDEAASP
jgi:ubiquinol-cytochrome c reductase cytochrome c subunit